MQSIYQESAWPGFSCTGAAGLHLPRLRVVGPLHGGWALV